MKKKFVAIMLAIFVGGFGAHKFYLRQPELGVAYIALFIWLERFFVFPFSSILGWYDAFKLMTMDQVEFDRKYNSFYFRDRYGRRLEKAKSRQARKDGRYLILEEDTVNLKDEREGYLKPFNRMRDVEQFKQTGIKKFKDYDTKGAIEDFKKALEISPEDKSLNFNIACAYSLEEQAYLAFYHLDKAVANGFIDFDKIMTHEALAYIRVMPEFELFQKNKFRAADEWLTTLKSSKPEEALILKAKIPVILNQENR